MRHHGHVPVRPADAAHRRAAGGRARRRAPVVAGRARAVPRADVARPCPRRPVAGRARGGAGGRGQRRAGRARLHHRAVRDPGDDAPPRPADGRGLPVAGAGPAAGADGAVHPPRVRVRLVHRAPAPLGGRARRAEHGACRLHPVRAVRAQRRAVRGADPADDPRLRPGLRGRRGRARLPVHPPPQPAPGAPRGGGGRADAAARRPGPCRPDPDGGPRSGGHPRSDRRGGAADHRHAAHRAAPGRSGRPRAPRRRGVGRDGAAGAFRCRSARAIPGRSRPAASRCSCGTPRTTRATSSPSATAPRHPDVSRAADQEGQRGPGRAHGEDQDPSHRGRAR